jgi:hypothetical protein
MQIHLEVDRMLQDVDNNGDIDWGDMLVRKHFVQVQFSLTAKLIGYHWP